MEIDQKTGLPVALMNAKGHNATMRVSEIIRSHKPTQEQLRNAFKVYDDLLDKKISFTEFPRHLQEAMNVRLDMAEALAGEIAMSQLRPLDQYFGGVDIFKTAKNWLRHGKDFSFKDMGSVGGPDSPAEEMPDLEAPEKEEVPDLGLMTPGGESASKHVKRIIDGQALAKAAQRITNELGIQNISKEQLRRIRNILLSQVKDVRDVNEATQMYMSPEKFAGVGLDKDKAVLLASSIEKLTDEGSLKLDDFYKKEESYEKPMDEVKDIWEADEARGKERRVEAEEESESRTRQLRRDLERKPSVERTSDIGVEQVLEPRSSALASTENRLFKQKQYEPGQQEKPAKSEITRKEKDGGVLNLKNGSSNIGEPPVGLPVAKKKSDGIGNGLKKAPSKPMTLSGAENFKDLNPSMIRMAGGVESAKPLIEKGIARLEKGGVSKDQIFANWKKSELYQIYLDMGRQSIFSGNDVKKVADMYRSNGKPYLQSDEFELVADISKELQS